MISVPRQFALFNVEFDIMITFLAQQLSEHVSIAAVGRGEGSWRSARLEDAKLFLACSQGLVRLGTRSWTVIATHRAIILPARLAGNRRVAPRGRAEREGR